ncbi:MAG: phospholipase A [Campylobacteraceae bacterium]|jgi:phospholipase A1|nr:phospholipase A [Campylobacteraceae bacterium]
MKRVFFIFFFISVAFCAADEMSYTDTYLLAEKYEGENKTDKALFWYKKAAQSLKKPSTVFSSKLEESLVNGYPYNKKNDLTIEEADYLVDFISEYEDNETKNTVSQLVSSLFGITTYKSNYLMPISYDFKSYAQRKHAETTFQFSVKKDLLKNVFKLNEVFAIAYTQRSWWQTTKYSSPFRETNYIPEIYVSLPHKNKNSVIKNYKFGFFHESNGQGEENSRSWNRLYMEIILQYKGVFIAPRAWYRLYEKPKDDDNSDILEYMGYGDLTLLYPYKNQLFKLLVRNNFDFSDNKGAVQFDWTFPFAKSGVFGYIQYFDGYGESLIDYNRRTRRIGIGLALSR